MTETDPGQARFETIDWDAPRASRRRVSRRTLVTLLALLVTGAVFVYDFAIITTNTDVALGWDPTALDWLFTFSLVGLVFAGGYPLLANRETTKLYWDRLKRDRLALAAAAYLGVFFLLGFFGPILFERPTVHINRANQPPLFFGVDKFVPLNCVGEVSNGLCHGTLAHPLGTNQNGKDMFRLVIRGMHVSLVVAVVTTAIIIPVATAVGTVSGYLRGRVDTLVMRYVDIQQTIPAMLIYIIAALFLHKSLFLIVVVFGLLSWGGVARVVRSEVLQRSQETYVQAARNAGASRLGIIREHILPNVSNTVVTAVTIQIPTLILAEAGLAYLRLGDIDKLSFGTIIARGMHITGPMAVWWMTVVPVIFLALTVFSFHVLGDALRDVLDPRGAR